MMDEPGARDTARLAVAVGAVAIGSALSLATYFAVQGPFGTINDVGNAVTGVLSGCLAWRLRRHISGRAAGPAVAAALAGAAITVVGSAFVVSGTSGFLFAGLISSVGFAGIGTWLIIANRSAGISDAGPLTLRRAGVAAGALMALGVVTAPGIILGLDDAATAPAWVWVGSICWLGTYIVYPAWAIAMGIREARTATRDSVALADTGGIDG